MYRLMSHYTRKNSFVTYPGGTRYRNKSGKTNNCAGLCLYDNHYPIECKNDRLTHLDFTEDIARHSKTPKTET